MNTYQQTILDLYTKYPKIANQLIHRQPELLKWIEDNCDPDSIDAKTKIYTAFSNEKVKCPCGSDKLRTLNTFFVGFCYCSAQCPAGKQARMTKRKQTNLKKYGYEFTFSSPKIQQQIKKTNLQRYGVDNVSANPVINEKRRLSNVKKYGHNHPSSTTEFRQKVISTNLKLYGVKNPQQNSQIKQKTNETNLKLYGVQNPKQVHYSELAKQILFDRDKFKVFLEKNGIFTTAQLLGVSESNLYVIHKKFGLDIIQKHSSSYELELANWLIDNNISVIRNSKSFIPPYELDIYLPDYKVAIEFNGLYWHAEKANQIGQNYHLNKTIKCQEQGIRLIHIFEDEWRNHKLACLDVISRILGIHQQKIMARKCQIRQVSNNETKDFLNTNHLQGYAAASINLGLFYEEQMIQLLTFRKARYNKSVQWENIRCCNQIGYQIVGGIQKLWAHFIKTYTPTTVVSYCDKRWFTGETYKKLKFTLSHTTRPQYWYTNYTNRYHRSMYTKKNCIKKALQLQSDTQENLCKMTEKYIAANILDLDRIWDCGQATWIWAAQ